jgi:hypothetical protein
MPRGQAGPAGTPRAPGHLTGAGGTPNRESRGTAMCTFLIHTELPGSPLPTTEGMSSEQAAALSIHMSSLQQVLPTPEKRWYDRLADSILGDDPCRSRAQVSTEADTA